MVYECLIHPMAAAMSTRGERLTSLRQQLKNRTKGGKQLQIHLAARRPPHPPLPRNVHRPGSPGNQPLMRRFQKGHFHASRFRPPPSPGRAPTRSSPSRVRLTPPVALIGRRRDGTDLARPERHQRARQIARASGPRGCGRVDAHQALAAQAIGAVVVLGVLVGGGTGRDPWGACQVGGPTVPRGGRPEARG
jgi:hypothetical protein